MEKNVGLFHGGRTLLFRIVNLFLILMLLTSCMTVMALEPYGTEPTIQAKGAVLYERNSRQLLYEKNADVMLYPASTTKIMTALLLLEHGNLDKTVTVSVSAMDAVPSDSSLAGLQVGEELTMYELLICLLVPSGNDAATVIAEAVAGSINSFVEMMNERAQLLGCQHTHFANPHGFHDANHYTTAADLLKITLAALEYPVFEEICGMVQATIPATNKSDERVFNSTNYMISGTETSGYLYDYCTGGKTGYTTPAGRCFVAFAEKDNTSLISVVLGSTTEYSRSGIRQIMSFFDTEALFDWAFDNFVWHTLVSTDTPAAEVPVALSKDKDYVVLNPQHSFNALLYNDIEVDDVASLSVTLNDTVSAPVKRGDELGTMTVYLHETPVDTIPLLASKDVERSPLLYILQEIRQTLQKPWVKWMFLFLGVAIILYILFVIQYNRIRRMKKSRRGRHRKQSLR